MDNKAIGEKSFDLDMNISILLVDDNKVNQFLGKKILRNLGILNVEVASDGKTALEMLQQKEFTILLTDVEMPGMNGYELTTAVRQLQPGKNNITIIALTANATEEERSYALKNGMNDYLPKPYSPQDLQQVLRKHLDSNNFMVSEFSQSPATGNSPIKAIYALFNGNKDDIRNFLILLRQQLPELVGSLKEGILSEKWDAVFDSAHKLKSTIKVFNEEGLFSNIVDITDFARSGSHLDQIPPLFDNVSKGLQEIMVLVNLEIESI